MYDQIRSMKLGNLSALDSIPDNYVHMLLDYVAQVSRALAHAHRHNCVHGRLSLARVLLQKRKIHKNQSVMAKSVKGKNGAPLKI